LKSSKHKQSVRSTKQITCLLHNTDLSSKLQVQVRSNDRKIGGGSFLSLFSLSLSPQQQQVPLSNPPHTPPLSVLFACLIRSNTFCSVFFLALRPTSTECNKTCFRCFSLLFESLLLSLARFQIVMVITCLTSVWLVGFKLCFHMQKPSITGNQHIF
jgi:hypothetical protein